MHLLYLVSFHRYVPLSYKVVKKGRPPATSAGYWSCYCHMFTWSATNDFL